MRFSDGGSPQTTNDSLTKIDFMNYSNTTTFKTAINRADNANRGMDAIVNLWRSTSAITSIKLYFSSGNIASGAIATLYGIKAA
jgi:anti-sigma-K factor RskA